MNILNTGPIFTTDVFIQCKNVWGLREPRPVNFDIPLTVTAFH